MLADLNGLDSQRSARDHHRAETNGRHGARTRHDASYDAGVYSYDNAPEPSYGKYGRWQGSRVHSERLPPDPPFFFLPRPPPPPAPPDESGGLSLNSLLFGVGLVTLNGLVLFGVYRNRQPGMTKLNQSDDGEVAGGAGAALPPSAEVDVELVNEIEK